jgi:signal transduction histidine kinase
LQQLLRNLVSNAIQYGSSDTPVRVGVRGDEAFVRSEVTNWGPTIEPSQLKQLFNPLRRGSAQGDRAGDKNGLGLGLFIVQEIARAHGGEVEVRSVEAETTFVVRLPRRHAGASPR